MGTRADEEGGGGETGLFGSTDSAVEDGVGGGNGGGRGSG